jgi:hypothetical protein
MAIAHGALFFNTPQTPSYSSAMSLQASSVSIFENFFGTNYAVVDSTQKSLYGTFSYSSLNAFLLAIGKSNIYSGTYFRFSVGAGIIQGRTRANGKFITI